MIRGQLRERRNVDCPGNPSDYSDVGRRADWADESHPVRIGIISIQSRQTAPPIMVLAIAVLALYACKLERQRKLKCDVDRRFHDEDAASWLIDSLVSVAHLV